MRSEQAKEIIRRYYNRPAEEFFNLLLNDPDEQKNLINDASLKTEIETLKNQLYQWRSERNDLKKMFHKLYYTRDGLPNLN